MWCDFFFYYFHLNFTRRNNSSFHIILEIYLVGVVLNGTAFVPLHQYQLVSFAHHLLLLIIIAFKF